MAQYNGYISVPHQTYQQWRDATYGNGYNVDYTYGNQCWDYCSLLYWQYGYTLITRAEGNGKAYMCWTNSTSRALNSRPPFIQISNLNDVKRGDIVVLNTTTPTGNGHIAFADEDYNGSGYIMLVGQNQGGFNGNVNQLKFGTYRFLGAFRNTNWSSSPTPPPPPTPKAKHKDKFPWAVALHHWSNFKH